MANSSQRARRLRDATRHLVVAHGALEATRRPCGAEIAIPHAYALLELLDRSTPLTVTELAERLAIDRTNVSRLCARMEADGELVRARHPDDARAWALRLTARGLKRARAVDERSVAHFADLAARLGGSTERVIEALRMLEDAMREDPA